MKEDLTKISDERLLDLAANRARDLQHTHPQDPLYKTLTASAHRVRAEINRRSQPAKDMDLSECYFNNGGVTNDE
jgi:Flp pilus assembly CpaE family ATPase